MIVNGRQAWNISTTTKTECFRLDNAKFCWGLAEELLHFKDELVVDFVSEHQLSHKTSMIIAGQLQSVPRKVKIMCCVCNLKRQFCKLSALDDADNSPRGNGAWSICNIVACSNESCHQPFYCVHVKRNNYIFQMPQFEGMTCFEIAHHKSTVGLWTSIPNYKYKQRGARDMRKKNEKHAYSVMTSHPIYIHLRHKYGLDLKKRKRVEDSSKSEEGSDEE